MNLVFSSIGDENAVVKYWLSEPDLIKFDLWLVYYGKNGSWFNRYIYRIRQLLPDTHKLQYLAHPGSKFQNLLQMVKEFHSEWIQYQAVFVTDDDIRITTRQVNRLFDLRAQYRLWILQPSFGPGSKISWDVTRPVPRCKLRFTSFVEMNAPLFSHSALHKFLLYYHRNASHLTGWGTDHLYMYVLDWRRRDKYAVVDSIVVSNPPRAPGTGIGSLQTLARRKKDWKHLKSRLHIPNKSYPVHLYGLVPNLEGSQPIMFEYPPVIEHTKLE